MQATTNDIHHPGKLPLSPAVLSSMLSDLENRVAELLEQNKGLLEAAETADRRRKEVELTNDVLRGQVETLLKEKQELRESNRSLRAHLQGRDNS